METDMKGRPYSKADYKGSLAIVIGNEGVGISPKIKKQCDFSVTIPIYGEIESFNASAAAAINPPSSFHRCNCSLALNCK